MQPTSSTDPPTVYRAVNADGDPVEVCISRGIVMVEQVTYPEPRPCEWRFGWEQE